MHPTNPINGTPNPSEAPSADSNPPEKKPGRDANGRFAKGNLGGPGNPFMRQIAGFRRALCNAVTEQDIAELAQILLAKAKAGDLLAMKLLFQYTLGRPVDAADPDSLDAHEIRRFQANNAEDQAMLELIHGIPADLAVGLLRYALPCRSKQLAGTMSELLKNRPEPSAPPPPPSPAAENNAGPNRTPSRLERKRRAKKRRQMLQTAGAPMRNGDNGVAARCETGPSPAIHRRETALSAAGPGNCPPDEPISMHFALPRV